MPNHKIQEPTLVDVFGNEINPGEQYYKFPNKVIVHAEAIEDYLIEVLGASVETKA